MKRIIYILFIIFFFFFNCTNNPVNVNQSNPTWALDEEYFYDNGGTTLAYIHTYNYIFNDNGNVIEQRIIDSNNTLLEEYKYYYDNNSTLIKATIYYPNIDITYTYYFTYNNGLLINYDVKRPILNYFYRYSFDYSGNLKIGRTRYKVDVDTLGQETPVENEKFDYYYDKLGRLILDIDDSLHHGTYEYNNANKLIKYTRHFLDTTNSISYTLNYTYDKNGNTFETIYMPDGTTISWKLMHYYNELKDEFPIPSFWRITF